MRFGIIGMGSIGRKHARNLIELGHSIASYDHDPESTLWGIDTATISSVEGLVGVSDAVLICTTLGGLGERPGMIDACLKDHIKGLFIEKPLCLPEDIQNCESVYDGRVMMGNMLRFHPVVERARNWLPSIGAIHAARFEVSQYNAKYLDSVLLNWGAHEIDLAVHLLGSASVTYNYGDGTCTDMGLDHGLGRSAIHLDYQTWPSRRGFTIYGDKGNLVADLEEFDLQQYGEGRKRRGYQFGGTWNHIYMEEMKAFISLCNGKPVQESASGGDGLATMRIIEEARNE